MNSLKVPNWLVIYLFIYFYDFFKIRTIYRTPCIFFTKFRIKKSLYFNMLKIKARQICFIINIILIRTRYFLQSFTLIHLKYLITCTRLVKFIQIKLFSEINKLWVYRKCFLFIFAIKVVRIKKFKLYHG